MTLIAGVRGVNKSYIISDSRETITAANGVVTLSDGAKKWINHGRYSLSAIAGDAQLGAYITNEIVKLIGKEPSYEQVRHAFETKLKDIATKYNQTTGRYPRCVILLAGYNKGRKDCFDAGRIGEVMGAGVRKQGEGKLVNQNIDKEIIKAMHYAMIRAEAMRTELGRGSIVTVDTPLSEVTGYKIEIKADGVAITKEMAGNFEAIFYGADAEFNRIELPTDIISEIYFRDIEGHSEESIIKSDTIHLFAFFQKIIEERGYQGVGGGVFPVLMTPNGGSFYAGGINRYSLITHKDEIVRETDVIDGAVCYKDENGNIKPYRSILELAQELDSGFTIEL